MNVVTIEKADIDEAFRVSEHQNDVLLYLYRCVFPNWDDIKTLKGFPKCNDFTWKYISKKFMDFDREHHPDVMRGGAWMNSGFSGFDGEGLGDFEVEECAVELICVPC